MKVSHWMRDTKKHIFMYDTKTPHQFSSCWSHCHIKILLSDVLKHGLGHIWVSKPATGVHLSRGRRGLHWDSCQTLLLPSCGFNKDRIRPRWVNELRCMAEKSIRSALKANGEDYWANRKVSALNKHSGIRNTNRLLGGLMNSNFHLY